MRILLADDHTLFRDTVVCYFERSHPGSTVSVAEDLDQAIKVLAEHKEAGNLFDLVLLDLRMPGMNGLQGLVKCKEDFPEQKIAITSGLAETRDIYEAMDLGAAGFFPKTLSGKALVNAIQLVVSGERYIPIDQNTNDLMPTYKHGDDDKTYDKYLKNTGTNGATNTNSAKLTPREIEVVQYLMKGASNKEIARDLDLQVVTVKLHVRGICRKLQAKNRTQAALRAKEMGYT